MTSGLTWALAATCALCTAAPVGIAVAAEPTRPYVVVYDTPPGAHFPVRAATATRERALGFTSTRRFRHVIDGFAARLGADDVRALRADPAVALVEPDRVLRATRIALGGHETVPTGVARIGAAGPAGVHPPSAAAVAVLDTGIDLSHPELAVRPGPNCAGAGTPADDNGHGTFVAGVIGARNDGAGVVGVAPGTELYAVKVLGPDGNGYVADIVCGIEWVSANARALGIRVVNMSLSRDIRADALHLAIRRSVGEGLVYTVAAGNSATDVAQEVPGGYPEVLTVTAAADSDGAPGGNGPAPCDSTDADDSFASFSNFATRAAEIAHVVAAPGSCITSTGAGGGEVTGTGTSAAAPHVAGVVAACIGAVGSPGACADMTPAEVTEQVRADAAAHATLENGFAGDPFRPVEGRYYGHLVSGVDPTVRRIPVRTSAPVVAVTRPAAPRDSTLELVALRIRATQAVDRLRVVVRLAEAGTITATARIRILGRAARVIRARRATATAVPGRTYRLRLRLPAAARRRVKRALRDGARVRARVRVRFGDRAGNAGVRRQRVRLRLRLRRRRPSAQARFSPRVVRGIDEARRR